MKQICFEENGVKIILVVVESLPADNTEILNELLSENSQCIEVSFGKKCQNHKCYNTHSTEYNTSTVINYYKVPDYAINQLRKWNFLFEKIANFYQIIVKMGVLVF